MGTHSRRRLGLLPDSERRSSLFGATLNNKCGGGGRSLLRSYIFADEVPSGKTSRQARKPVREYARAVPQVISLQKKQSTFDAYLVTSTCCPPLVAILNCRLECFVRGFLARAKVSQARVKRRCAALKRFSQDILKSALPSKSSGSRRFAHRRR